MASGPVIIASAIVASSVLLLVGFYVMSAQPQPQPQPGPPTIVAPAPAPAPAKVEPPPPPQAVTPEMQARGAENARLALEARRAEFVERCWNPSAARQPEPRQIPLRFVLGFDGAGRLAASGIVEDREVFRPDVTLCLRGVDLVFNIPAPGLPLQVEVPFTLP